MDNWPIHTPPPTPHSHANKWQDHPTKRWTRDKIVLAMQFQGATKQEANPATVHLYYEDKSSGMENPQWYSSSGDPFCVTLGGYGEHVTGETCLCECVSCVTKEKKNAHDEKTTVDVLLPGMQWHRSPLPSAKPEYRKCLVRRCRPEPRYL